MANVNDILLQAVGQNDMLPEANADAAWVPPVIPTTPVENKMDALVSAAPSKQANVAAASAAKQHSMTPADYFRNAVGADTGKGRESATQQELDLRDMNPAQLRAKYGKDARDMIIGQAGGYTDLSEANTRGQRSPLELWDDFNVTFGQGLGGALGGLGALATGVVSETGGTAAAEMLGDFNKFMDENKTPRLQAREQVKDAKSNLDEADNAQQMLKDVETDGELMAGLKRVGRDTIDALSNATDDPATFGAGVTNALGSFVAAGPVAKGLSIASKGALGTTTAIAATEAGGSYAGATQSVMERSHEQLMDESPNYRGLIEAGVDPEEAKRTVANRAGLVSAAITAPVAAAAGRLVHRFEGNPLALGSGRALAGNVARETAEETIQSGAGQFAQNVGDRLTANEDADLSEGVGRQLAEGGLYGMGMTTALGIPSISKDAAKGTGRVLMKAFNDRVAGIEEANKKASPVSNEAVAQAAAEQQATAPAAAEVLRTAVEESEASPDVKAAANEYVDNLMLASNYDAVEAPPSLSADFQDVTTRHGAIQRAAGIIMGAEPGSPTALRAGFYLNDLLQDYAQIVNGDQAAMEALPADSQAAGIVNQYKDLIGAIASTPQVVEALETVMGLIEASEAKAAEVTPETLATPEGQQDVQDVLGTAELAPEKVDLATGEKILYQIEQGNLTVTPRQKAALDTSVALLRAVQEADKASVANGNADPVSLNISSVDGEKGMSLTQHAKGIMSAWKSGDRDLAMDRLTDLRNFAEGMGNKVAALNAHFAAGKPNDTGLSYQVYVGGQPVSSKSKVAVRTGNEGSVKFAQKVAGEAKLLADVYNGLTVAFPDLQAKHLAVTPLADGLNGPAADVVAAVKAAKVAPVVKQDVTPAPVKSDPAPKKETAPVVTPVTPEQITNVMQDAHMDFKDGMGEEAKAAARAILPMGMTAQDTGRFGYFYYKTPNGKDVAGAYSIEADGTVIRDLDIRSSTNESGTSEVTTLRNIAKGLQAAYPKLNELIARRVTGVREGNAEFLRFAVKDGKLSVVDRAPARYADGDPRIPDAWLTPMGKAQPKAKPQPAPVKAEPVVVEETAEPTEEVTPALKGTAAVFSKLRGGMDNLFNRSFKLPEKAKSRTLGTEAPVKAVREALANSAAFTAFLGSSPKGDYTKEIATAYKNYLSMAEDFVSELDDSLQAFLSKPYSKKVSLTAGDVLLNGATITQEDGNAYDPLRSTQGKALNITEEADGTLVYNPELIENVVLAGLQWFLNSPQYGSEQDASDIASLLGMTEATVSDSIVAALNEGMSRSEAIRSLAQKIRNYWGVTSDSTAARGYLEGIPEAMADEMLSQFVKGGWLTETTVKLTEADGLPALDSGKPNVKEYIRMVPSKIDPDSPLHAMPSAIDQAVLVEPEGVNYIGEGNIPKVAQDQLRNPGVANTEPQKQAIANEQATPYKFSHVMAGMYNALGRDTILKWFGAGEIDRAKMNSNHADSLEGVNRSVLAAFDHFTMLLGEVGNSGPVDSTPVHFAFNMTRVGRLQMLGKHNPQSNKLMREVLLPTYSTLDLSSETSQDYRRFMLGVAQMLGEKVHNMSQATSRARAEAQLNGPLAQLVEEIGAWTNSHTADAVFNPTAMGEGFAQSVPAAFKAAGYALTPMAFHALVEFSRVKAAKDKSAITTPIYVEADGMTNGPINAMMLFTTGLFKGDWIRNMAKGGLFFNSPGETANSYRTRAGGDSTDLYQATTTKLDSRLTNLKKALSSDPTGSRQMDSMLNLMDEFYGGDLKYFTDPDGNTVLELKRGIAKNPLTITIYGSGAGGIAAKMTKLLTDAIYERMSQVAEARANGETSLAVAMFGPQSSSIEDAEARFARFVDGYQNLTNTQAGMKKDGTLFFKSNPSKTPARKLDPTKFTFDRDQILNMQSNIRYMFVDPMRDAISASVGQELLDTAEMLRQATQAQSIVLEHAFKAEVEAALAEKAKDPNYRKGEFLTPKEEQAIRQKLAHLSPLVQTEGQSFFIAGTESADVEMTQFARSLDGKMRSPAFVAGPKDAGVSGIPFLNIGAGDGLMMQLMSNMKNAITGTLKIFDGVNMPLDQMELGSEQANQSVYETWTKNPLAAVHKSFSDFLSDAKLTGLSKEANLALSKSIFGLKSEAVPEGELIAAMQDLAERLNTAQLEIEARHRVMSRVSVSIDQMAAVGVPFAKNGDLPLVGNDADSIAEQLNAYLAIELASLRADQPVKTTNSVFDTLSTEHTSGARVMSAADLKNLPSQLTKEQSAVLGAVIDSMAADGYKIVSGTAQQIADFDGSTAPSTAQGWTNIGSKTIYLVSNSPETMLHELVHAASFEAVNAHYQGTSTPAVAEAVGRIETMMGEFLASGAELTQTGDAVNSAFNNVSQVVNQYLSNGQQAEALNEFMAWTLTNESLVRVAQRQQVSKLARYKDKVVSAIKSMLGIKESVGKDLFSNLLFNSSIVMQAQPKLSERYAAGMLFQNPAYGTDERLSQVAQAFDTAVGRYLDTPVKAGNIDEKAAFYTGIQNAYRVAQTFMARGFNMNMQEASTFNSIVTALSTEAAIDPNAMAGVQQLYAHVMKNLSPESFMADAAAMDPNDYAQAVEKFDVLSGKYLVTKDLAGRSSLLPAFLALATTNNQFRDVLSKMDLPKSAPNKAGTLDALLENTGNMLMGKLGAHMQGTKKAKNVQQALDMLNGRMVEVINQRDTFIDTAIGKTGGVMDRTNEKVVDGMGWLSNQAMKLANRTQRNAAGRIERAVGGVAAGFAALINEESAQAVAEGTMASINKTKMWDSVHTMINDLVGRTENNAMIYDMIKAVRSVVQRTRQQYREDLPGILASKFTRELTKDEKASLHRSMAKTDLAALGKDALTIDRAAAIASLEADLSKTQHWTKVQAKAKQLANFMNTGVPGKNLLRNPEAVARLLGEGVKMGALANTGKLDRLITLYALEGLDQSDKDTLASLAQDQKAGMEFTLAYLQGQRAEEMRKATGQAQFNYYKGYTPSIGNEGVSMLVAHDSEYAKLIGKSYQRVGDYEGSSLERGLNRGYYFIPVAARAAYEQGIMQNVHQTAGGVDQVTGHSLAQMAGRVTDAADVKKLARVMQRETGPNNLLPVYGATGEVVAFERSLDPVMMEKVLGEQDLHKAIGMWRGRQVEEGFSQVFNEKLVDNLAAMYNRDIAENPDNARQYVDVFASKDPVLKDAAKLVNMETRSLLAQHFGDKLMVRRDMLNDVVGYRSATIGDAWTGNSRWSPETQKAIRNVAVSAFGNDAYRKFMNAEKTLQNIVGDAKVLIVVKSVVVPIANLMSNMYQLVARGVPLRALAKGMPSKLTEVENYTKTQVRLIEAEAELRASGGDLRVERRLKTEIQAIKDSHKRMSIWPLIEAGEFSGISDAGMTRNEIPLTSGRLQAYMEQAASKLPGWGSTVGRYALVTKDTALFQGLQKSVEYGDFLAKAILFDHYVGNKGMTKAEAMAKVTEEFVNYDRLAGRNRSYLESIGMLWFYNFKIRSVKVAASMIRNNPVHTLLSTLAPQPDLFGTIGLPTEDNMITKLMDGTLDRSIGPGQGFHSAMLNPWVNLTQ